MKSRQEIKALAKEAMQEQRDTAILIVLMVTIVSIVGGALIEIPIVGVLIFIALTIFFIVLDVGVRGAFIKIYKKETTSVREPFDNIQINSLRKLGGMLWMSLWLLIWYIPGVLTLGIILVIKSLSYSMTGFILADCPNVPAKDALKLSMRMTKGYEGEIFMLGLSFIGWFLLSILTLGVLAVVYVTPYYYTSLAGYYVELRDQAISSGTISIDELQ